MPGIHKMLLRQIKKSTDLKKKLDKEKLYQLISQAYEEADKRYSLLHQAMDLMSDEMLELNSSLREEALKTKAIFQSTKDGILSVDSHGRIHSNNKAARNIFEYQDSELCRMSLEDLLPDFNFSLIKSKNKSRKKTCLEVSEFITETTGRRKGGEVFYAEVHIAPISMAEEELYVCNIRDITAQKEYEKKIFIMQHTTTN